MNGCVSPAATFGLGGVTWMETRVAGDTVNVAAGEVTSPEAAVMLLVPTP